MAAGGGHRQKVYVSSTYVDLKEHRAVLKAALEQAGLDAECMEKYPAFDQRPLDKCLEDVAECDFHVLLIAHRYGFEPPDGNPGAKSITQLEYEEAGRRGKPRLVFVVDEAHPWPPKLVDRGRAKRELDALRKAAGLEHGIATFTTPDDLAKKVVSALSARREEAERRWQRAVEAVESATQAPPPAVATAGYRWPAAWDFAAYMADKREAFGGRDWLFGRIDAWLAAGGPRALLVHADFGVGKSAAMAELVRRNPGGAVAAWHFCQHDTQETLRPATFVRSIAAQLKDSVPGYREAVEADPALQERLDGALADPASAFEGAVLAPLARLAAPPGAHRLLIVDALDEALELDAEAARRGGTVVSLLAGRAGRFPPWLRVLVTSRGNPQVVAPLQQTFGLERIDAESAANRDDLRRYILSRCAREPLASVLRGAGLGTAQVAGLLDEKSGGKFLYAVRALHDLERGAIAPAELAGLPPGMDGFYLDAFARRYARAGRPYEAARAVLGVVATAREPLAPAALAQVLGTAEAEVKAVHRDLPDFLRLRGGALAFEHFSLAEWLTRESAEGFPRASEYAIDLSAAEAALRRWALARIEDGTARAVPYLLRHLASHLRDAGERGGVYRRLMLEDMDWLDARLRLPGVEALIADCAHLGEGDEARLLRALWRSSAHALRRHPDQLPAQVAGRLLSLRGEVPALDALAKRAFGWRRQGPAGAVPAARLLPTTGSLRLSVDLVETFTGHTGEVTVMAVLPDGWLASGSRDGTVRVWDLSPGRQEAVFLGDAPVTALAATPDGAIVAGDTVGAVHFLRLT